MALTRPSNRALTRPSNRALELDRVQTPRGELVLRQDGEHFDVISNGVFLMDTRNGESERLLIVAALDLLAGNATLPPTKLAFRPDSSGAMPHCPRPPWRVLIGGLGVGFSLVEALSSADVDAVTVIEVEPTVVEWHRRYLAHITSEALRDRRSKVVVTDIREYLATAEELYDGICLDVDNGPDWTVTDANASLYGDDGTALLVSRLAPGGVLTVWSAAQSPAYERVLRRHFGKVEVIEIPVPRGEPDVVFAATQAVSQTQGRDSDSS
jgi:hypothetical protein